MQSKLRSTVLWRQSGAPEARTAFILKTGESRFSASQLEVSLAHVAALCSRYKSVRYLSAARNGFPVFKYTKFTSIRVRPAFKCSSTPSIAIPQSTVALLTPHPKAPSSRPPAHYATRSSKGPQSVSSLHLRAHTPAPETLAPPALRARKSDEAAVPLSNRYPDLLAPLEPLPPPNVFPPL